MFSVVYKNLPEYKGCDEYLCSFGGATDARKRNALNLPFGEAEQLAAQFSYVDNAHDHAEVIEL